MMSSQYRSMTYAAVATLHFYRCEINHVHMEVHEFIEKHSKLIKFVILEIKKYFDYELSSRQIEQAVFAYLHPSCSIPLTADLVGVAEEIYPEQSNVH